MTEPTLESALRALPHFKTLPGDLLADVASMSKRRTFDANEAIFREGDPCHAFYAIESGSAKLYRLSADGSEQVVHSLQAGATFAEAALLSFGRFPIHAKAMESGTVLLEIGGERFLNLFRTDPRMSSAMVASLAMRLISLVERVEELSLVQAGSRLARWLLRQPVPAGKETVIELALAKKDLAGHLAMTPETLSRLLQKWQEQGWLRNERSRVVLLETEKLIEIAS